MGNGQALAAKSARAYVRLCSMNLVVRHSSRPGHIPAGTIRICSTSFGGE